MNSHLFVGILNPLLFMAFANQASASCWLWLGPGDRRGSPPRGAVSAPDMH
jgi:hypothetical protein